MKGEMSFFPLVRAMLAGFDLPQPPLQPMTAQQFYTAAGWWEDREKRVELGYWTGGLSFRHLSTCATFVMVGHQVSERPSGETSLPLMRQHHCFDDFSVEKKAEDIAGAIDFIAVPRGNLLARQRLCGYNRCGDESLDGVLRHQQRREAMCVAIFYMLTAPEVYEALEPLIRELLDQRLLKIARAAYEACQTQAAA